MNQTSIPAQDPKQLSPLTLAYVGDGIFELLVRTRLVEKGNMPVGRLHSASIGYVSAANQAKALDLLYDTLTEEEQAVYRRGRNNSSMRPPHNQNPADYRKATGFEALFGFLYLQKNYERLIALFDRIWENIN